MEIARSVSERGEVVLRQREHDRALELRVNGVFVMDTVETRSERALAHAALDTLAQGRTGLRVLVGGLGLGFTLAEVLADPRVGTVLVAEIEPALVGWHRSGLVPPTAHALADPRTTVAVDDVRHVVATRPADSVDLLLLDVDNGPGYLVYDENAYVYRQEFLQSCLRVLGPAGVLAIWSADSTDRLLTSMRDVFGAAEQVVVPVTLGSRETSYRVLVGRRWPH